LGTSASSGSRGSTWTWFFDGLRRIKEDDGVGLNPDATEFFYSMGRITVAAAQVLAGHVAQTQPPQLLAEAMEEADQPARARVHFEKQKPRVKLLDWPCSPHSGATATMTTTNIITQHEIAGRLFVKRSIFPCTSLSSRDSSRGTNRSRVS
jgi:hypothetical protein